jgi:hypothetical protein
MGTVKRTTSITAAGRRQLLQASLRRANRRRHRPCSECGQPRVLCSHCARMWCIECHPDACPWPHTHVVVALTPLLTKIPTVGTKKKHRRLTDQIPDLLALPIPRAFENYAREISALGYEIRRLTHVPEKPGRWEVEVFVPKDMALVKPEFGHGWFGHHLYTLSSGPTKKGTLIVAEIGENS